MARRAVVRSILLEMIMWVSAESAGNLLRHPGGELIKWQNAQLPAVPVYSWCSAYGAVFCDIGVFWIFAQTRVVWHRASWHRCTGRILALPVKTCTWGWCGVSWHRRVSASCPATTHTQHIKHCVFFEMANLQVWLLSAPGHTGPHWARTGPEITNYFVSTTVIDKIKAKNVSPWCLGFNWISMYIDYVHHQLID